MDGYSGGYPDDMPDRELRAAMHTIGFLKNDIAKLQAKLNKTRELVLDDNISNDEKKRYVIIEMHIERIGRSMDNLAIISCQGGNVSIKEN